MKRILCLFFLGAGLVAAQTTTPQPPASATFFQSAAAFFTSFDTNSTTFSAEHAEVWASADYQSGLNFAAGFGVQYELPRNFVLESFTRNAGIAGTIVSEEVGAGWALRHYDVKLTFGADGGYNWHAGRPQLEVYADLRKALTPNTFAGIRLSYLTTFNHQSPGAPVVGIITGFKF